MDADMSDDEREVQIRMDAEQYIPFPLDEVSLDFEVLPDRLQIQIVSMCSWSQHEQKMLKHALKCLNWQFNPKLLMLKVMQWNAL
jgi:hypothetical protein